MEKLGAVRSACSGDMEIMCTVLLERNFRVIGGRTPCCIKVDIFMDEVYKSGHIYGRRTDHVGRS